MEQAKFDRCDARYAWDLRKFFVFICLCVSISGCRSEDPNPELKDPIYQSVLKDYQAAGKEVVEIRKEIASLVKEADQVGLDSVDVVRIDRSLKKERAKLRQATDRELYLKIRSERRKVEARRSYKIALINNKEWPSPDEYRQYKAHERLISSDSNWDKRVPKLFKNSPNYKEAKKAEAKEKNK